MLWLMIIICINYYFAYWSVVRIPMKIWNLKRWKCFSVPWACVFDSWSYNKEMINFCAAAIFPGILDICCVWKSQSGNWKSPIRDRKCKDTTYCLKALVYCWKWFRWEVYTAKCHGSYFATILRISQEAFLSVIFAGINISCAVTMKNIEQNPGTLHKTIPLLLKCLSWVPPSTKELLPWRQGSREIWECHVFCLLERSCPSGPNRNAANTVATSFAVNVSFSCWLRKLCW